MYVYIMCVCIYVCMFELCMYILCVYVYMYVCIMYTCMYVLCTICAYKHAVCRIHNMCVSAQEEKKEKREQPTIGHTYGGGYIGFLHHVLLMHDVLAPCSS